MTADGNIIAKSLPSYYCENCNLYYIYNNEYEKIKKVGVPLCTIYEYERYIKGVITNINFKQESILHSFGYNVGQIEDLTDKQRREKLSFIIENGVMNKHEVISLINHFIDMRKGMEKQKNAVKKWESDIGYLKKNNINPIRNVEINSIKITRNKIKI